MRQRKPKFIRSIRRAARRRDMAPTPAHLETIRRAIVMTATSFGRRLAAECIEDLVQETLLGLWKSKAEHMLGCVPYVRRVAANVTVDLFRRESAQKRRTRHTMGRDLEAKFWPRSRTPEEMMIEREEAQQLLEHNPALKRRVRWAVRQYEKAQAAMAGGV